MSRWPVNHLGDYVGSGKRVSLGSKGSGKQWVSERWKCGGNGGGGGWARGGDAAEVVVGWAGGGDAAKVVVVVGWAGSGDAAKMKLQYMEYP